MSPEEEIIDVSFVSATYSSFLPWQKKCIIGLAASAGWFSSISSFVYFPAIPFLASDLHVSVSQVNLTFTSYLIMSGIFPAIIGDAADRFGRRPALLAALAVYVGANIALALQTQFALLVIFRMLQSAGISGTFSIAYGVLGDLFTPAERGGYSGVMSFLYFLACPISPRKNLLDANRSCSLNTPPSLGPILSGLLLLRWSWRSVFWFLTVASAICLVCMVLFLPETARSLVSDGSIPAKGVNKAALPILSPKLVLGAQDGNRASQQKGGWKVPNPWASLDLLRYPDTGIILVAYGINYSVYCCVQASLSTLFVDVYHVSGLVAGMIYIPFGVACAFTAFMTGRLLDISYRKTAAESGIVVEKGKASDLGDFPIERARLRYVKLSVVLSGVCVMGYGWLLQAHTIMAAPLVLQFFIGLTIQTVFTALNTLLVDTHPECPSTAQAACNFVRCEMAAACLAALDPMLRRVGPGWSFTIFGAALFLEALMLVLLQAKGMEWRRSRSLPGQQMECGRSAA